MLLLHELGWDDILGSPMWERAACEGIADWTGGGNPTSTYKITKVFSRQFGLPTQAVTLPV